jgi:rhamnulokinase
MSAHDGPTRSHTQALVAVDLGAESCRVSLLRWQGNTPVITLVHRFPNHSYEHEDGSLRWNLGRITEELDKGLTLAAETATEGIASIAVDGWAVDYVRLDAHDCPLDDPFCYRDERTLAAEHELHEHCPPHRMRKLTGIQLMRINTLYQQVADRAADRPAGVRWLNLPEFVLARWGAAQVAELTNASHTQMLALWTRNWSPEILEAAGLDPLTMPTVVPPGTAVGRVSGHMAELPALHNTVLIAPACHDTASAIAGIPATGNDWAYISSGTWSLVGTLLEQPRNGDAPAAENFTNLGAVGGGVCFHKNVNGMWLLRQSMEHWETEAESDKSGNSMIWTIQDLVAAAASATLPEGLLDVDDPDLLLPGDMPARINAQRKRLGYAPLEESAANAPQIALLIFQSLAVRYAEVLKRITEHSGKQLKRLFIVGGASQNELLNRLTAQATGLEVFRGSPESSTIGNFAVQLAVLDGECDLVTGAYAEAVSRWAAVLGPAMS